MTVITKASDLVRKPDVINAPLVGDCRYDPERMVPRVSQRTHVWVYRSHCSLCMLCLTLCTVILLLLGAVLGLIYYTDAHQDSPRYKGFCAIPIEVPRDVRLQNQAALAASRMPLHWSAEPEVTVFSTVDEEASGEALTSLLERFDIAENVEKISVYNSGHNVEFIHDFNANATGIVDSKRCFMMELDPSVVLSPHVFVFSIERGDEFDVMRVRSNLHALVPPAERGLGELGGLGGLGSLGGPGALPDISAVFAEKCADRPTYRLQRGNDIIRKRSVDEPAHEYLHFAGKHVQEIAIDNLHELLAYESKLHA